ncbi:hypothetical protein ACIPPQ_14520 [Sphingopyxis sp. LARHCG72]
MIRSVVIATALFAAPASAAEPVMKLSKAEQAALAMPAADAALRVKVTGLDELDPNVWVSTEPFLKGSVDDKFFRAMIDKSTGEVVYQIYLRSTSSRGPLRLSKMTYLVDGTLRSASIERIGTDVSCQRHGCTHFEDAIASVPREDLEALAKGSDEADTFWKMRLFGDAVSGIDSASLRNETAGFLIAVDRERKRLGFDG